MSRIEDPNDRLRRKIDVLARVQADVVTGRATVFLSFDAGDRTVRGSVVTLDGGDAAEGTAVVRVHQGTPEKVVYVYQPVKLVDGTFADNLKETGFAVDAYSSRPGLRRLLERARRKPDGDGVRPVRPGRWRSVDPAWQGRVVILTDRRLAAVWKAGAISLRRSWC